MSLSSAHDIIHDILYPRLPYRSLPKDYSSSKNVNAKICAECGGQCCKRCGCIFSPDDFKEISFDFLRMEIEKWYITIDFFSAEALCRDIGVYVLRVRNQNSPIVYSGTKESPCILLTEKGCKLSYDERPSGGKLLIPSKRTSIILGEKEHICPSLYTYRDACYEWLPHKSILSDLADYFEDKDFPCSL